MRAVLILYGCDYVVKGSFEFYSRFARHAETQPEGQSNVNMAIFKSDPNMPQYAQYAWLRIFNF